jgi:oxalate decarboxylase/phosphoglucose isomerase-like protein (cupin superfamily)
MVVVVVMKKKKGQHYNLYQDQVHLYQALVQKKKKKNLSYVYARCKICIMEPENFEETIKNKN